MYKTARLQLESQLSSNTDYYNDHELRVGYKERNYTERIYKNMEVERWQSEYLQTGSSAQNE